MIKRYILAFSTLLASSLIGASQASAADLMSPYSWDPGLYATSSTINEPNHYVTTHSWGVRKNSSPWGTGPVNYQSGSTVVDRMPAGPFNGWGGSYIASNFLDVDMYGTYCPNNQCSFGSGSGYKGIVQLWNDPNNYIAFGIIKDPSISFGKTLMIEGSAHGQPIGGYWSHTTLWKNDYNFDLEWDENGVTLVLGTYEPVGGDPLTRSQDQYTAIATLGKYPIRLDQPSVSFLSAARDKGDLVDVTFEGTLGNVRGFGF